jgi:formate-dependent nitrite reductase membrane component NrfD
MSDTFFTASPEWSLYIIPYFFIGGIAGGAYFLAALLEWFGRSEDHPVIRTAYGVAFWGSVLSGLLLTIDLGRPLRFWHMLVQSQNFPEPLFKGFSPMSFGAWTLLLFGGCAFVSRFFARSGTMVAKLVAVPGGAFGVVLAGYTGVLLAVTNRPIWADSPWLGALFLASGASTAAAAVALLSARRGAARSTLTWLASFDARALVVELVLLIVFIVSLGTVARVWLSVWGVLLLVGVVGAGILWPLRLHLKPAAGRGVLWNPAVMVLLGGLLLRAVVMLASEGITVDRMAAQ